MYMRSSTSFQKKKQLGNFLGRNHVKETTRYGIVARCLWEENLGNVTVQGLH